MYLTGTIFRTLIRVSIFIRSLILTRIYINEIEKSTSVTRSNDNQTRNKNV